MVEVPEAIIQNSMHPHSYGFTVVTTPVNGLYRCKVCWKLVIYDSKTGKYFTDRNFQHHHRQVLFIHEKIYREQNSILQRLHIFCCNSRELLIRRLIRTQKLLASQYVNQISSHQK